MGGGGPLSFVTHIYHHSGSDPGLQCHESEALHPVSWGEGGAGCLLSPSCFRTSHLPRDTSRGGAPCSALPGSQTSPGWQGTLRKEL